MNSQLLLIKWKNGSFGVYLEIFLFRIKWSKIRVRIIHGHALYTGKYGNWQFTILVIACLFSCSELVTIGAHGLEFSAEVLFLSKTFESARSGSLQIETDEGYDALCIIRCIASNTRSRSTSKPYKAFNL